MAKSKPTIDPRGHSLRIYKDIYISPAFKSLSPVDVMAYLALLAELKQYNNGDLSLPLTRAKQCGIGHHITLARSLRALCAVGLVSLARKGGSTKGGQRLPSLYRLTDRDCYEIPKLHLEALSATNDWKRVATVEQGHKLIKAVEDTVKKETAKLKSLGHAVATIRTPSDVIEADIRTPGDTWDAVPGHLVTMAENTSKPLSMRVSSGFDPVDENASHRTPTRPPLYVATPTGESGDVLATVATSAAPAFFPVTCTSIPPAQQESTTGNIATLAKVVTAECDVAALVGADDGEDF